MLGANAILIDGIDMFADVGLIVETRDLSRSAPAVKLAIGQSPFAFRRRLIGRQATDILPVTLQGTIITDEGLSIPAAQTQLNDRIDRFKWRLRQQREHTVTWEDISDRFWTVEFTRIQVRGVGREFRGIAARIIMQTSAVDPRASSSTETTLGGTGSPFGSAPLTFDIIPIGDAPQGGIVRIVGNTATPLSSGWELEYRDEADAVLKELIWDGIALESTDTVRINLEDGVVELDTGAGFANAVADLRVGSDLPIKVDADDGTDDAFLDQIAAKVPDLTLTGSGDVDEFTYVYRARFW